MAIASVAMAALLTLGCGGDGEEGAPPSACVEGETMTVEGCLTCQERDQKLSAAKAAAVQAHHQVCTEDTDCTLVDDSTQCAGSCWSSIHTAQAELYRDHLDELSADYCKNAMADCGYATPGCIAVEPVCEEERCTTRVLSAE